MAQTPKLIIPGVIWDELYAQLGQRGKGETESGAFLLGKSTHTIVENVLYYDDLEPGCLETGGVWLTAKAFIKLADYCLQYDYTVKADVHTHPFANTAQSLIDMENPMIKVRGHLALIIPHLAMREGFKFDQLGIHEFIGSGFYWKRYYYRDGIIKISNEYERVE